MSARILARKYGPIVNNPRMLPTIASPHPLRRNATIPPASAIIDIIAPIIPQTNKNDWSCSMVIGEFEGRMFWIMAVSTDKAAAQVSNPSSPARINNTPEITGIILGLLGC